MTRLRKAENANQGKAKNQRKMLKFQGDDNGAKETGC